MNIIETKKLTKYYLRGKVLGIKDLNLEIKEGEIFGFIGPNGAGKSTTIRLLLDLIRPTSGSIAIFDLDAHTDTVQIKKNVGYLPGEIFLTESMTGKETLAYYQGFKKEIDRDYVNHLVKKLGLDLSKKVGDYSKGNKQKLGIVLAIMHKPKLLILDEPTSGLDPLNQAEFYNIITATKKWGTTTFLSTHILEEAQKICDRVGIIKNGKLIKIETLESIPLSDLKISGVTKIERTTFGYHLTTAGKNGPVLKALAKFKIADIQISEPSLEEIFMRFYKD